MPSKYGFGNTRKKSPYEKGKPHYGKDQKNPMPMLGDLDKDGKLSGYEKNRQDAIEKNMEKDAAPKMNYGSPVEKYGSPVEKYGKSSMATMKGKMEGEKSPNPDFDTKGSMAPKKKKLKDMPDAQRKAVFASGYKG